MGAEARWPGSWSRTSACVWWRFAIFSIPDRESKKRIPIDEVQVYKDYKKVLESDVDAVIFATPVYLHPEHLEAAVQAGNTSMSRNRRGGCGGLQARDESG